MDPHNINLPSNQVNSPVFEILCRECHRPRSRRGAFTVDLPDRAVFVCKHQPGHSIIICRRRQKAGQAINEYCSKRPGGKFLARRQREVARQQDGIRFEPGAALLQQHLEHFAGRQQLAIQRALDLA